MGFVAASHRPAQQGHECFGNKATRSTSVGALKTWQAAMGVVTNPRLIVHTEAAVASIAAALVKERNL
jgi:hypothetical protein